MKSRLMLIACALCAASLSAATIHVPADQPTIQAGIDAAVNGDTVLVAPGTYTGVGNREISTHGKPITLRSSDGAGATIIDGEDNYDVFHLFSTEEDSNTVIEGFTITNALSGLTLESSQPQLRNLIVSSNDTGIIHYGGSPFIVADCYLSDNGIGLVGTINCRKCTFVNNVIGLLAVGVWDTADCIIDSSTFIGSDQAALGCFSLRNSIVRDGLDGVDGYAWGGPGTWYVVHSCLFENLLGTAIEGAALGMVFDSKIRNVSGLAAYASTDNNMEFYRCQFYDNTGGGIKTQYIELGFIMEDCVYRNNSSGIHLEANDMAYQLVRGCTIVENGGSGVLVGLNGAIVENTIIAHNTGFGLESYVENIVNVSCCNVFGNDSGNYNEIISDQTGINGNISADPLFCDTANRDYTIASISPCAPENNTCGVLIGAFGVGCLQIYYLSIANETSIDHVVGNTPVFVWSFDSTSTREQFELAVGIDTDWTYAEMWNPAPFISSDTFATYAGAPLVDGTTYYIRLRVYNGAAWSAWHETSFRMNSVPSMPVLLHPINDEYATATPTLWILNSTDTEADPLTYDFFGFHDTDCVAGGPGIDLVNIPEGADSTGGQITDPLGENCRHWWKTRAFDGYEYSDWSDSEQFWVNGAPEPPSAPQANFPPDTSGLPVFDMLPEFWWSQSYDPDPLDTVKYKLEIAIDSGFNFVYTVDSIASTTFTLTDSLQFSKQYWWRVTAFDNTGMSTMSSNTPDFWTWTLGDLNHSHVCNVADLTYFIDCLFRGGLCPYPLFVGDINGDCNVNIGDLTYLVDYLFRGGPAPKIGCEKR